MTLFGRRRLLLGVLAGALGSVALAWVLFDPARRLARLLRHRHPRGRPAGRRRPGAGLEPAGTCARGTLGPLVRADPRRDRGRSRSATSSSASSTSTTTTSALFHGGYLWLALFTAVLIAVLAHPAARLGGLLARPPLLWLGLRSYSFYLWHWPVLALTRPGIDVSLPRGILIPLQLLAVLGLADLSYRFVELPFRAPARAAATCPTAGSATAARRSLVAVPAVVARWSAGAGSSRPAAATSTPGVAAASTAEFARVDGRSRPPQRGAAARRPPRIVALGDSVMIGAKDRLAARLGPRFSMNAKVGRQADEFVDLAERLQARGGHVDALIIQMGNNGPLYGDEMEALRKATSQRRRALPDQRPRARSPGRTSPTTRSPKPPRTWPHTTLIDWRVGRRRSRRSLPGTTST